MVKTLVSRLVKKFARAKPRLPTRDPLHLLYANHCGEVFRGKIP